MRLLGRREMLCRRHASLLPLVAAAVMAVASFACAVFGQDSPTHAQLQLAASDRILILAPHPDDEILGCAGIIQEARALDVPVKVAFLTYGDNNEWAFLLYRKHPVVFPWSVRGMGMVRHDEAIGADTFMELKKEDLMFLGYPDFGTFDIWYKHWGGRPAYKSMLTKVSAVPYQNAFRPHAAYKGEEILKDIKAIIDDFRPTKIFVSHPADYNGDHRALYLFTQVALWDLHDRLTPELYPYLVHYKHWPMPRGHHPQEPLVPPPIFQHQVHWQSLPLSALEVEKKTAALQMHRSQFQSSAAYLETFLRTNELFGNFPCVILGKESLGLSMLLNSDAQPSAPEQLLNGERALFVGFQEQRISFVDGKLVFSITLSKTLAQGVGVSVYLFGYRHDREFAAMPKLRLKLGAFLNAVYDQKKKISLRESGIRIQRQKRTITISIPVALMGNPERILMSANTYLGNVPLDWASWRVIEFTE